MERGRETGGQAVDERETQSRTARCGAAGQAGDRRRTSGRPRVEQLVELQAVELRDRRWTGGGRARDWESNCRLWSCGTGGGQAADERETQSRTPTAACPLLVPQLHSLQFDSQSLARPPPVPRLSRSSTACSSISCSTLGLPLVLRLPRSSTACSSTPSLSRVRRLPPRLSCSSTACSSTPSLSRVRRLPPRLSCSSTACSLTPSLPLVRRLSSSCPAAPQPAVRLPVSRSSSAYPLPVPQLHSLQFDSQSPARRASVAGVLLAGIGRWRDSSVCFESVVKFLPQISPRFLELEDQEYMLSHFPRITALAVSVALRAGAEVSHCLRLLELGRGIIMGLVIDCRSDLSELRLQYPEVFNKFNRLRMEVDSPLTKTEGGNQKSTDRDRCCRREQVVHEMEKTLVNIRQLPGFEGFQLPPLSEELIAMAKEGPIAILNGTVFGSEAIIVTDSVIKALALPRLVYGEVIPKMKQISQELVRGGLSTYSSRNKKKGNLLFWLWDVAVEPVLEELQLDAVNDGDDNNLTRIWWIGVGPLAIAPFHAAGGPSSGSTRNTLNRVISSYIPSIKALSYARQKKLELFSALDSRILLVIMPTTLGRLPLKNAASEAEEIASEVGKELS